MSRNLFATLLVGLGLLVLWSLTGSTLPLVPWAGLAQPEPGARTLAPPAAPEAAAGKPGAAVSMELRPGNRLYLPGQAQSVPVQLVLLGRVPAAEARVRLPLNVALVVDRSSSMEQDGRMEQVRRTLSGLIEALQPEDSVALVSYGTGVTVHRRAAEPFDREALREAVLGLRPAGGTNLYAGLEAGCAEVLSRLGGGINRVLLFSDGEANIGRRDPRSIVEGLSPCLQRGVSMSSIGVGVDFNEDLMAELAERGRGNYHYAERPDEIALALAHELAELGSVVARGLELRLELGEGVELERLYGYEHRREGRALIVPLKDLASGERLKLLAELRVEPQAAATARSLCAPLLAYVDSEGLPASAHAGALVLEPASAEGELAASADPEVTAELQYTRNSVALHEASGLVAAGKAAEAERRLRSAIDSTRAESGRPGKGRLKAQAAELEQSLGWIQDAGKTSAEPSESKAVEKRLKKQARGYTKN
jgi:Ca-activated chloride channel homolog